MSEHAAEIKRHLADPTRLLEALDMLGQGKSRSRLAGGWLVRCPVHEDRTPSCSVQVTHGVLLWHCHACDASGDALSLVAVVKGLSIKRDFRQVMVEAARIAGLHSVVEAIESGRREQTEAARPAPQRPQAASAPERTYPDGVAAFWGALRPVTADLSVVVYLQGRAIDPESVESRDLARALPRGGALPAWARYHGQSWRETAHRLILPVYDHTGTMRSVRAWRVVDGESPKRLPPGGHRASGLVLADERGVAMLAGTRDPERIIIAEGEPDFLVNALRNNDAGTGVVSVLSGSWSDAFARRVPIGCRVYVRTHVDDAGEKYAAEIEASLRRRAFVYRLARTEPKANEARTA